MIVNRMIKEPIINFYNGTELIGYEMLDSPDNMFPEVDTIMISYIGDFSTNERYQEEFYSEKQVNTYKARIAELEQLVEFYKKETETII